jgi:hypothetical protein
MVSSPHPWLDTTTLPLYVWNFPADAETSEAEAFIAAWEPLVRSRAERYAVVVDLAHIVSAATPANRNLFAQLEKRMALFEKSHCAGVAFVAPNPFLRGIITAVLWVAPPPYQHKFFSEPGEARSWAEARLEEKA